MPDVRNRRLVAALVVLAAAAASAQPAAPHGVPVDSLVAAFAASNALPSLTVGLIVDGERHVVAAGDVHGATPDADTRYEIGSITKVLTSLALADAVVRGETTLETPLADVLGTPVAAHPGGPVRLVDLATHTSGLPRLDPAMEAAADADPLDPYAAYGPGDLLAHLAESAPRGAPGAAHLYSNLAVGALGYALATLDDTTYAAMLADRVLAPLGMATATVGGPDARTAVGHNFFGAETPYWRMGDAIAGAGAVVASVSDLLALAEAAIDPDATPLADAVRLSLEPRHEPAARNPQQQALGWFLYTLNGGSTLAAHSGGTGGFRSFLAVVPSEGLAVVVLTNRTVPVDPLGIDVLGRIRTARAARP